MRKIFAILIGLLVSVSCFATTELFYTYTAKDRSVVSVYVDTDSYDTYYKVSPSFMEEAMDRWKNCLEEKGMSFSRETSWSIEYAPNDFYLLYQYGLVIETIDWEDDYYHYTKINVYWCFHDESGFCKSITYYKRLGE